MKTSKGAVESSFISGNGIQDAVNVVPTFRGHIVKRRSWKGWRTMVKELKRCNDSCKKYKFKTTITVTLPLRGKYES